MKSQTLDANTSCLTPEYVLLATWPFSLFVTSFVTILSEIFHAQANICFMCEGEGKTFFKD